MKCKKCKFYGEPTNQNATTETGCLISFPINGHCIRANYYFSPGDIVNNCPVFEKKNKSKKQKTQGKETLYKDCIIHKK